MLSSNVEGALADAPAGTKEPEPRPRQRSDHGLEGLREFACARPVLRPLLETGEDRPRYRVRDLFRERPRLGGKLWIGARRRSARVGRGGRKRQRARDRLVEGHAETPDVTR